MKIAQKTLLSIAGFDPSGGAGALADLRVFRDLGYHGAAALTAITVQSTSGVGGVEAVTPALLARQVECLENDLVVAGIKVGMAATEANLRLIGRICGAHPEIPRVVDPVFRSSSGRLLLDRAGTAAFVSVFRGRITVVTPNLDEAAVLAGGPVADVDGMVAAARTIAGKLRCACLVKGGHLSGEAVNVLDDGRRTVLLRRPRLRGDVHGTGCLFSSALLGYLAAGRSPAAAAAAATDFTHAAIDRAVRVGRGRPVGG